MTVEVLKPRPATRRKMGALLFGVLIIVAAIIYLLITSVGGSQVYYMTVAEAKSAPPNSVNELRVSGVVDGDSIQWDAEKMLLRFAVADSADSDGQRLEVVYKGVRPDMLREGATAILEGKLGQDGVFQARTLLLSCPSKYQAAATATAAR